MSKNKTKTMDSNNQHITEITIPQMGEGLREVKIIKFLKSPGDYIKEDEVIYEMETDKSIVEIESAYEGKLLCWKAKEGETVPVGTFIAQIEVCRNLAPEKNMNQFAMQNLTDRDNFLAIPPRTRQYCKLHGITTEEMLQISYESNKLMPRDVDKYLGSISQAQKGMEHVNYVEVQLTAQQQQLIHRFSRSKEKIVPVSMTSVFSTDDLRNATRALSNQYFLDNEKKFISDFQVFAYCVSQTCISYKKFCSVMIGNNKVREYKYLNLGIAVNSEDGDLMTAVIPAADSLTFADFATAMQDKIEKARQGQDQAKDAPHIILSYMGNANIISGSPLLVEPAVAVIFMGNYCVDYRAHGSLSITFDHRLINGMDVVDFLQSLHKNIKSFADGGNENGEEQSGLSFKSWLLNQIAILLRIDAKNLDQNEPLGLQGLNSIMAISLAKLLSEYFKKPVSPTIIWHYPTCAELIKYFCKHHVNDGKLK